MTRKLWMSLLVATVVSVSGCDDGGGVPDGGLVQPDGARLCTGGETLCDGTCVDTTRDTDHCGACGAVCGTAEACLDGTCTLVCPSGQEICDGRCVDLATDEANCGACGDMCSAGETCTDGACELVCPDGQTECDGACVDLDNNPANCGACGFTCDAPVGALGLCASRRCRVACDGAFADCNADLGDAAGDGCEIDTDTDADHCGACRNVCSAPNATSGCAGGACEVAMCDAGFGDCDMDYANGCEQDLLGDDNNCGACGNVCPAGEFCLVGACTPPVADDCSSAVALSAGANTVNWLAFNNDYLTTRPSCTGSSVDGPDIVMSYTAAARENVEIVFDKPTSTRWVAVVSTEACGTVDPSLACISDFSPSTMSGSFNLAAGETAYVYLADTTSGSNPLDNPVTVTVNSTACASAPPANVTALSPPNGGSTATLSPTFEVTFDAAVIETTGVITITGDMGTSLSYDLSTAPSQVSFNTASTVMTIDPATSFPSGETLTISWSGLESAFCSVPIPAPTWTVTMPSPTCSPGVGGMVGTTVSRIPTGLGTLTEYYVAADDLPTGYVYFGGTTDLYRVPKLGGPVEDVEALAGLTSSNLGYEMVIVGAEIYVIESKTSGTTGHIFRISTNGGLTWAVEDYATFPTTPGDDFRGATAVASLGRIFMVTDESSSSTPTEIWSVPIGGVAPVAATLELSFTGASNCSGIDRDDTNYYLACGGGEELVRVPIGGGTPFVITDAFDLSSTTNDVYGEDLDMDGTFDVLYFQSWYEEAYYVCDPASATPFASLLVDVGGALGNYGMGFDGTSLYILDDDTREVIVIQ